MQSAALIKELTATTHREKVERFNAHWRLLAEQLEGHPHIEVLRHDERTGMVGTSLQFRVHLNGRAFATKLTLYGHAVFEHRGNQIAIR